MCANLEADNSPLHIPQGESACLDLISVSNDPKRKYFYNFQMISDVIVEIKVVIDSL